MGTVSGVPGLDCRPPAAVCARLRACRVALGDPRCPHDAWVERVEVLETGTGERQAMRSLEIRIRLLGAYHDGHIELAYEGVRRYRIGSRGSAHGDWLYDELRLSADGFVLHEIEIAGDTWEIECQDVACDWKPKG